jgi:hypothetical protein
MPVLGVVQRVLERRLLDVAGLVGGEGRGGAVTLIPALRLGGEPEHPPALPGAGRGVPQRRRWRT